MGRFNKFLGKGTIKVDGEEIVLNKISVQDIQKLVDLSKLKDNEIIEGVKVVTDILANEMPEEPRSEIEAYVLKNYADLTQEIIIALGWTTREKLDAEVAKAQAEASKKKD